MATLPAQAGPISSSWDDELLSPRNAFDVVEQAGIDVSDDGTTLAFVEQRWTGQAVMIAKRAPYVSIGAVMDTLALIPDPGAGASRSVEQIRISGDGRHVIYVVLERTGTAYDYQLWKVDVDGLRVPVRIDPAWLVMKRGNITVGLDDGGRYAVVSGWVDPYQVSPDDPDFVQNDIGFCSGGFPCDVETDVYLMDLQTGEISPVTQWYGDDSYQPSISGDGRWVSFTSLADFDGVEAGTGAAYDADVFVVDRTDLGAVPVRVTRTPDGAPADAWPSGEVTELSSMSSLSDDGRFVVFSSFAGSLVDEGPLWTTGVFLRDRDSDGDGAFDEAGSITTTQVSAPSDAYAYWPAVSNDGLRVSWNAGRPVILQFVPVEQRERLFVAARSSRTSGFSANAPYERPLAINDRPDMSRGALGRIAGDGRSYGVASARFFGDPERLWHGYLGSGRGRFPSLGWVGQILQPGGVRPVVADPVNTASGALVGHAVDLTAPGGSPDLRLERSYDSLRFSDSRLGLGWVTNWDMRVDATDLGVVEYVSEHGRPYEFTAEDDGSFERPDDLRADLVSTDTGWRLEWFDGSVMEFDVDGALMAKANWDGSGVDVVRSPDASIDRIEATTGDSMTFTYTTDADGRQRVESVAMSDGRAVSYQYADTDFAGGVLATVVSPEGTTSYTHDEYSRILTETDASGVVAHTTEYDSDTGRVVRQTLPTGEITEFTYDDDELTTTVTDVTSGDVVTYRFDDAARLASITDPSGNETSTTWTADEQLAGSTDRLGHNSSATYDENGNLTSLVDPVSGTTSYVYDELNRVVSVTEPTGATTTMAYEGDERLPSSVTDALGAMTTFDVVDGLVVSVTDADGVSTLYGYDAQRRMDALTNGLGHTWTYEFDAVGRQVGSTTPLGFTTSRTFDDAGRVLTSTAADGGVTSYTYDVEGRLLSVTDPTGAVTENSYDPVTGLMASTTDPAGRVTTYVYNSLGELTAVEANDGGVSETDYGTLGRVTATRDAVGRESTYAYDANGNRTEVVAPDGGVSRTEYDTAGRVAALEDPLGRRTTNSYDEFGRLVSVTHPDGTVTSYTYDMLGRLVETTAPDGGVTSTTFTPAGRMDTSVDAEGGVTSYGYDAAGQTVSVTDPNGHTTSFEYDADGRQVAVITPEGLVQATEYDPLGRVTKLVDPAGVEVIRSYTLRGELASEQREGDGVVSYAYNPDGTMASVTDALGNATSFGYDAAGRQATRTDATGAVEAWEYNAAGDLVAQVDRMGQRTEVSYDASGRVDTVADPSGRVTDNTYDTAGQLLERAFGDGTTVGYAYDEMGRRTSMVDATGTTTYEYDANGRPVEVAAPGGELGYAYDLAGRRTGLTYPDGATVTYDYDAAGRLVGLTDPNTGDVDYTLDDDGRVISTALPDGETREFDYNNGQLVRHEDHGRVTDLAYDASGRLSSLSGALNHNYAYDDAGQLLQAVQDEGTYAYTYGPRGEVTSITDPTRTRSFTHNANTEIASIVDGDGNSGAVVYDEAGRMVEHLDPDGTVTSYTYDARGLLIETVVTTPGDSDNGGEGGEPDPCAGLSPTIVGTEGDDVLQGTWQDDVIVGLGGNDTIAGASGADIICGGDGDDIIRGESGGDTLHGGAGDDTIYGADGADSITGGPGNDELYGESGADIIDGGGGADAINGGSDWDTLDGGDGTDVVDGSWQADICDDAEQAISCETITFNGTSTEPGDNTGGGVVMLCNGLVPTIVGTDGDDVLQGTWQDDVIVGLGGNDTIHGASGSDTICGGDGDDLIHGESQADTILGEAGNDTIDGADGEDVIDGGDGDDTIAGDSQNDTLLGGAGHDAINGGSDNDAIDGGDGTDTVDGSWHTDDCIAETVTGCETSVGSAAGTQLTGTVIQQPPPPPTATTEIVEQRILDGDGTLTGLIATAADGTETADALVWDVAGGIPQIVERTTAGVSTDVTYGYQRESVGAVATEFDPLGNQLNPGAVGTWSPFGSTEAGAIAFGYRGELESLAGVHLRARTLNPDLATLTTIDPLDGVVGTPVLTDPYHYANNNPTNMADPLGLRAHDAEFDPCAVHGCWVAAPPSVERWVIFDSVLVSSGTTVSYDLDDVGCTLFQCDVRVRATFAAGEFVGGGFVRVRHWNDSTQSFADVAFFSANGRSTVMQFRRREFPETFEEQVEILEEIPSSGSLQDWFNGGDARRTAARVEITVNEASVLSAGGMTSPSLYLIDVYYNTGRATAPRHTPFTVDTGG